MDGVPLVGSDQRPVFIEGIPLFAVAPHNLLQNVPIDGVLLTGSTESMEMGKSMEVTNMCTALERLKAEGIEQGMEKGVEKTVISMLKKNYPISEICDITGKTEEEILKIKETM